MKGTKSKTEALYVPSMWRGFKIHENIPSEEIDDIELVGDDFMPSTYISFTPTFKYLGTITSWDLRECNDVQARIKAANKLFGSAKATFWSNSRVPFGLQMRFYKAIIVNVLLWGGESWAIKSKEVHSHTDSLKRIGEASLLGDGATVKAPFVRKQRGITVNPQVRDLFRLIQSESWPAMMEKYLAMAGGGAASATSVSWRCTAVVPSATVVVARWREAAASAAGHLQVMVPLIPSGANLDSVHSYFLSLHDGVSRKVGCFCERLELLNHS